MREDRRPLLWAFVVLAIAQTAAYLVPGLSWPQRTTVLGVGMGLSVAVFLWKRRAAR